MDNGIFPEIIKTGKIMPIFKIGNKENLENYRAQACIDVTNFRQNIQKIIQT